MTLESLRRWVERRRSASAREAVLEAPAGLEAAGAGAEVLPGDGAEPRAAAAAAPVEAAAAPAEAGEPPAPATAATAPAPSVLSGPAEAAGPSERALKSLRQWFERLRSAFAREVPPGAPTALEAGTEGATPGAGANRLTERDLSAELSAPAEPSALPGPTEPSAVSGQAGPAEGALEPLRRWFERRRSASALEVPRQASTAPEDATAEPDDSRAEATKPRAEPAGASGGTLESLRRWFERRRSAFARVVSPQASTARENTGAESADSRTEPDSRAEPAELPVEPAATPRAKPAKPRAKRRADAAELPAEPAATPRAEAAKRQSKPRVEPAELPPEPAATPRPKPAGPRAKPRAEAGEPPVPPLPQSEAAVTPRPKPARPRGRSAPPAAPE